LAKLCLTRKTKWPIAGLLNSTDNYGKRIRIPWQGSLISRNGQKPLLK